MQKVHLDEVREADKAKRGLERVKQIQLQFLADWTDNPKRIDVGSATQAR